MSIKIKDQDFRESIAASHEILVNLVRGTSFTGYPQQQKADFEATEVRQHAELPAAQESSKHHKG